VLPAVSCFPDLSEWDCSDFSGCPDPVSALAQWSRASLDSPEIEVQTCVAGSCLPWVRVVIDGPVVSNGDWSYRAGTIVKQSTAASDAEGVRCALLVLPYAEGGFCLVVLSSRDYDVVDGTEVSWRIRGVGGAAAFEFGGPLVRRTEPLPRCNKPEPVCQYSDLFEYYGPPATP
jgi:hypothetical protein